MSKLSEMENKELAMLCYLDGLRKEGSTNMQHGATIKLQKDFGVDEDTASRAVAHWFLTTDWK